MTEVLERADVNDNNTPCGVFTTTRAELVDALATVAAAIPSRPPVPCMAGVLLESSGTDLWVRGFDYGTSITVRIPDAVETPGRTLVNYHELSQLLKALTKSSSHLDSR